MMGLFEVAGAVNMLNGWTAVATAGTELPLLGVTYATGTLTTYAGQRQIIGSGTVWTAAMVGQTLRTAGDQLYTIVNRVSNTELEVREACVTAESGVAYKIYRRPRSRYVYIKAKSTNTNPMFVGVYGNISSTVGWSLAAGDQILGMKVDLSQVHLWVDATTNGEIVHWIVLE